MDVPRSTGLIPESLPVASSHPAAEVLMFAAIPSGRLLEIRLSELREFQVHFVHAVIA